MTGAGDCLAYLAGFGNEHQSEALSGALPVGQRSPQRAPYGLYAEQLSGTAFTAPRADNRRSWLYRIRPSVTRSVFEPVDHAGLVCAPVRDSAPPPAPLRWRALPIPETPRDWLDGLVTIAAAGDVLQQTGLAIHLYLASSSMTNRSFRNADGEMLIVPQQGRLRLMTELGALEAAPGEVVLVPRGMAMRIELPDGASRGYICENYGQAFTLPERGPVGSDGFANERDFLAPVAAYEDSESRHEMTLKFAGRLYRAQLDHSPFDVVAWWGNNVPYKYDLSRFMVINSVSFDHPDPSIYTVLTSPSHVPGTANADFVIFPPRWQVATGTFRPPPFHRNIMSEFMGLIHGRYESRPDGFEPGGATLHNCMLPHGPATDVYEAARQATLVPERIEDALAFMFESRLALVPTPAALSSPALDEHYADCWNGLVRHFNDKSPDAG